MDLLAAYHMICLNKARVCVAGTIGYTTAPNRVFMTISRTGPVLEQQWIQRESKIGKNLLLCVAFELQTLQSGPHKHSDNGSKRVKQGDLAPSGTRFKHIPTINERERS